MGIARGAARLILASTPAGGWKGSLLQLGRQDVHFTFEDLAKWATLHDFPIVRPDTVNLSQKKVFRDQQFIDDNTFFRSLGFDQVESCDYSDYEQPTHVVDLNRPVDQSLHGKYDVIFNGGTMEHVFHLPQVLSNIFAMLKPGGRVIHFAPSSNHVEHGFYMFSPTFFHDYYTANLWAISSFKFFEYTRSHEVLPWRIYDYTPGCLDHCSMGGFDRGYLLGIFFVAEKTDKSVCDVIPQQGLYQRTWPSAGTGSRPEWLCRFIAALKKCPHAYHAIQTLYWVWRDRKSRPRIAARY